MALGRIDIKWYSKYVFLVGAILSFADPVTDILTLVEFYLADHKTWFAVGLCFMILPWFPFGINFVTLKRPLSVSPYTRLPGCSCLRSFLIAFNPFSAAVARLKMFVICIKNREPVYDITFPDKHYCLRTIKFEKNHLLYSQKAAFFEAVLESAPQFVIQLYVVSVQAEPVSIIQMTSLPVSFLSLVWTFTSTEELWNRDVITNDIHVKHKILLFITYLFILSSRLFAVTYFTVSYKWWIISVLMLHSIVMAIVGYISRYPRSEPPIELLDVFETFGTFCTLWMKDDVPLVSFRTGAVPKKIIRWLANVLFVVENLLMILLFYFSGHSDFWYALPVTICVCVFAVFGATMRISHFYFLQKEEEDETTKNIPVNVAVTGYVPQPEKNITPSTNLQHFHYCYETAV